MAQFAWLDEVRGLLYAVRTGSPSYAGNYKAVYFCDFKTLAYKRNGEWILANKTFPLDYPGGCYGMARELSI